MIFNICLYVLTAVSVILAGIFLAQRRHLDTGGSKRLAVLYALLLTVAPTLTVIGVVNSGCYFICYSTRNHSSKNG